MLHKPGEAPAFMGQFGPKRLYLTMTKLTILATYAIIIKNPKCRKMEINWIVSFVKQQFKFGWFALYLYNKADVVGFTTSVLLGYHVGTLPNTGGDFVMKNRCLIQKGVSDLVAIGEPNFNPIV